MAANSCYQFGDYEFDPGSGRLLRDGVLVTLQPKPARLLNVLLKAAPEPVTREALFEQLWSHSAVAHREAGLNTCVGQLRRALGDKASAPHYVETIPRVGYRLRTPVKTVTRRRRWTQWLRATPWVAIVGILTVAIIL